jgi:hypothetical protein
MLVVLDTTVLLSDPCFVGLAWRAIGHARAIWKIEVFVPQVVVTEAIAGYRRATQESQDGLTRWIKNVRRLGLPDIANAMDSGLAEAMDNYPALLRKNLEDIKATIVEPPAVDHMVLVERAVSRRRPCNENGDGYRDSLNWMTVLALAAKYPDDELVWVSENSKDFGGHDKDGLHDDLLQELESVGAAGRVRWFRNLPSLITKLAAEHSLTVGADLRAIRDRLHRDSLEAYVLSDVASEANGRSLEPRLCGLPISTRYAHISNIQQIGQLELEVHGTGGSDQTVVQFALAANVSVILEKVQGSDLSTDGESAGSTIENWTILTKQLVIEGIVTLDERDRPAAGEITQVFAPPDDPGHAAWKERDNTRSQEVRWSPASIPPDFFKGLSHITIPPEVFKNLTRPMLPPEVFKNLTRPMLPPEVFKNLTRPMLPPEVFKNLTGSMLPPETLKGTPPRRASSPHGHLVGDKESAGTGEQFSAGATDAQPGVDDTEVAENDDDAE